MRFWLNILIIISLSACSESNEIPLAISTSKNDDGSTLVKYNNSSKRDICVSKASLSADPLADFPDKRTERKVIISEIDRNLVDFQFFAGKGNAELEAWRGSGMTVIPDSYHDRKFDILIQAFYCEDLFSNKKNLIVFEYFEKG